MIHNQFIETKFMGCSFTVNFQDTCTIIKASHLARAVLTKQKSYGVVRPTDFLDW